MPVKNTVRRQILKWLSGTLSTQFAHKHKFNKINYFLEYNFLNIALIKKVSMSEVRSFYDASLSLMKFLHRGNIRKVIPLFKENGHFLRKNLTHDILLKIQQEYTYEDSKC